MHDLFALLYFRWLVFKELNVMWKKTYSVVKHFIGVYRNIFLREPSQYFKYWLSSLEKNIPICIIIFFMLNCFTTKCTCCINMIVTEIEIFLCTENMIWYFERTWLRLFQKFTVRNKFDIYIFIIYPRHIKYKRSYYIPHAKYHCGTYH